MELLKSIGLRFGGVLLVAVAASQVCDSVNEWAWFFAGFLGWVLVMIDLGSTDTRVTVQTEESNDDEEDEPGRDGSWAEVEKLDVKEKNETIDRLRKDLMSALTNLGVTKADAKIAVEEALCEKKPGATFEDLFRLAVRKWKGSAA